MWVVVPSDEMGDLAGRAGMPGGDAPSPMTEAAPCGTGHAIRSPGQSLVWRGIGVTSTWLGMRSLREKRRKELGSQRRGVGQHGGVAPGGREPGVYVVGGPEKKVCQDGARLNARRKGSEVEWDGPRGWVVDGRSCAQGGEGRFQWASEKQPLLWRPATAGRSSSLVS